VKELEVQKAASVHCYVLALALSAFATYGFSLPTDPVGSLTHHCSMALIDLNSSPPSISPKCHFVLISLDNVDMAD
jgi:hypothetical protein